MVLIDQIVWIKQRDDRTMQAEQVLHNVLQQTCREMHRTRRQALAANVMAALHGTTKGDASL